MTFKITAPLKSKKTWVIAGAALAGIGLVAAGGWFWWGNQSVSGYNEAIETHKTDTAQLLTNTATKLQSLRKSQGDYQKTQEELKSLKNNLTGRVVLLPETPQLLGISPLSGTQKQYSETLKTAVDELKLVLDEAYELLAYQAKVTTALKTASSKNGNTLKEQKALVKAWQTLGSRLSEISPPGVAKSAHDALQKQVKVVASALKPLPGLFEDQNRAKFEEAQQTVEKKLQSMRKVSAQFKQIITTVDQNIAQGLNKLQALLQ